MHSLVVFEWFVNGATLCVVVAAAAGFSGRAYVNGCLTPLQLHRAYANG
jgi:hypothetical protein